MNISKILSLLLVIAIAILPTCTSSKVAKNQSAQQRLKVDNSTLDLTSHLRKVAGLSITGTGEQATFRVRGIATAVSGNQPLYVVNGVTYVDYPSAYRLVVNGNFVSAKVLKNPSETSLYGVRGSNGVIVIKTR